MMIYPWMKYDDDGMTILNKTLCKTGSHTWLWAGGGSQDIPVDKTILCDCGRHSWEEIHVQGMSD